MREASKDPAKILGLMSGTSLDGVDAVLAEFRGEGPEDLSWSVLGAATTPLPGDVALRIREAIGMPPPGPAAETICALHADLGEVFAEAARTLLDATGTDPGTVSAVASHGQTLWHRPPSPAARGATLQLGDPATIAERTGIPVVSDFRSRDVAAGGQGAPLVPWADFLLFARPGETVALQNLGGMANVTVLPPRSGGVEAVTGFDTGPGVALVDGAVRRATGGTMSFDRDGRLALSGTVDRALLAQLLEDPFFREAPPKSTGRERFGDDYLQTLLDDLAPSSDEEWRDLVATLTALTVESVAEAYRAWVLPGGVDRVVLLGGGSRNPALAGGLAQALDPLPVQVGTEEAMGVAPEFREALCFAALGWAFLRELPGNVPGVTGARGPRILGSWTP